MENYSLKKTLHEKEKEIILSRTKIGSIYITTPLVLSFSLIDMFYRPDLFYDFLYARLVIIPVSIICYVLLKNSFIRERMYYLPAHIFTVFLGVYNAYLIYIDSLHTSLYFYGLTLAFSGIVAFLPWSYLNITISATAIFLPYYLLIIYDATNIQLSHLATYTAFAISTFVIGVAINILTRNLRLSDLINEIKLQEHIKSQDHIITIKTAEAVKLEKMAMQFSPQVIEATKNGEISLDLKEEKEIACIFIDIKGSTKISQNIDNTAYTTVITDFFTSATNILLKNNVTVGTYLGDGLLAYTNAPQSTSVFRENALNACIDLIFHVRDNRLHYAEKWRSEFTIRIGLNVGTAIVGFFPDQKLGCYTAIGEPVNLAARLCSNAKDNSICFTENLIQFANKFTSNSKLKLEKDESLHLIKGYEEKSFSLYNISINNSNNNAISSTCPSCNAEKFFVHENLDDAIVLKCTNCGYYDFFDSSQLSIKTAS